jgi:hypothetical protein
MAGAGQEGTGKDDGGLAQIRPHPRCDVGSVAVRFTPKSHHLLRRREMTLRAMSCRKQVQQKRWLFDHLVGALQERFRHRQTKSLGGLEVDY